MTMLQVLQPTAQAAWVMHHHYDPARESDVESAFAISNGFLGVRAARAVSRGPTWIHWLKTYPWSSWPRIYIAGLFERPNTEPPVPALAPGPDWLRIRIILDGAPLLLRSGETRLHRRTLDLRRGALLAEWHQRTEAGLMARLRTLRMVSLADRSIGLQLLHLEVEQPGVQVALEASFEAAGLGLQTDLLERDLGIWRSTHSGRQVAMAGAAALRLGEDELPCTMPDRLTWSWRWMSAPGKTAHFHRFIAAERSDNAGTDPGGRARASLERARRAGWSGALAGHESAWAQRWNNSDIVIDGDEAAQISLRFAIYHLNSAANPADERVSVGARALTGDSYLGHVFWDTEIYLLPFYTLTWPEAARAMLMYRFHTLPGARAKAAEAGWRGAMFAWESADTGEETTPATVIGPDGKPVAVLSGVQEQHITADIAYAAWQYWEATGDDAFLLEAGAEIVLEAAGFWASRATLEPDGRRHIRGVIGPDEFHENIDDNAFTNVMARWTLRCGAELAAMLRARWPKRWTELAGRISLVDSEADQWRRAADELFDGYDPATGRFEQFAGYFGLEDIDPAPYARRGQAIDVVLGRERTQRSQVVKQADVVALLALLPAEFDRRTQEENFRYYEPRCAHASSLSRAHHALVAARLGDLEMAYRYFRAVARTELGGGVSAEAGGVHIAAMGGLWQVAVSGFAGLSRKGDALALDPRLPAGWRGMRLRLQWRGRRLSLRIGQDGRSASVRLESGEAMLVLLFGKPYELRAGQTVEAAKD